jgi:signal transduction histidine kinase
MALKKDINYWRKSNLLEEGRNRVLRMVARNEDLQLILNTLCKKAQVYNPEMLCSILRLDRETKTLHPIASVSLPEFYCQALDGVPIGAGVGSCGTAAFIEERVIVEDINTHPYWTQYKGLALEAGVQACWSEPIIGANGIVFGTFAMYYQVPQSPTEEDLKFIELSANLAAVVFDNDSNRSKLLNANIQLKQTVNERTIELEQANLALKAAIEAQDKQYSQDIKTERMHTTNSLICGFSHEVNTPVGTAITAISIADEKLEQLSEKVSTGSISKKSLINGIYELTEVIELSKQSLIRVNKLLQQFKNINTITNTEGRCLFLMPELLKKVKSAVLPLLHTHQLLIQCDDFTFYGAKDDLWQIFFNLIENSIIHGFKDIDSGIININITDDDTDIHINFQDNGSGILEKKTAKIFEPFYTSNRNKDSLGLGLNIISNIISHNLQGSIRLLDSPIGIRYEIILPKLSQEISEPTV